MQRVGDAVDIVEVASNLSRVVDGPVVKACGPQGLNVVGAHLRRVEDELLGEGAQGGVNWREGRLAPVGGDLVDQPVGGRLVGEIEVADDLGTEVVGVGSRSVDAAVGP